MADRIGKDNDPELAGIASRIAMNSHPELTEDAGQNWQTELAGPTNQNQQKAQSRTGRQHWQTVHPLLADTASRTGKQQLQDKLSSTGKQYCKKGRQNWQEQSRRTDRHCVQNWQGLTSRTDRPCKPELADGTDKPELSDRPGGQNWHTELQNRTGRNSHPELEGRTGRQNAGRGSILRFYHNIVNTRDPSRTRSSKITH